MPDTELAAAIKDLVHKLDGVTFPELCRKVPGFAGDRSVRLRDYPNIILWQGVSQAGIDALFGLLDTEQIFLKPSELILYAVDAPDHELLHLPHAKKFKAYKTPHFFAAKLCKRRK